MVDLMVIIKRNSSEQVTLLLDVNDAVGGATPALILCWLTAIALHLFHY